MEWSDQHDVLLAREVLLCEPYQFKPRTVERGKIWQTIADHLNEIPDLKFRVTKRSTREHFGLLLSKSKAKRREEAKLSGVNVEDTELDTAMEEVLEKWKLQKKMTCLVKRRMKLNGVRKTESNN